MKKLMIAASAIIMAVAANATTTAWGIWYAEQDFAGAGEAVQFTGGTAFLYALASETAVPVFENGAWNLNDATLVTKADYDTVNEVWGKQNTASASYLADLEFSKDQNYAIVLTSEKATNLAGFVGDDMYAAVVTGVSLETDGQEEVGGAAFKYVDAIYGDQIYASDWQSVAAVPEPTSGLLLLLGVAGLALRRRRA